MIKLQYYCEVYQAIVLVFCDCTVDEMNKYIKDEYELTLDSEEGDYTVHGYTNQFEIYDKATGGYDGTIYIMFLRDTEDRDVLVHESVHLALRILLDRDIAVCPTHQEPVAYYIESWQRRIWEDLKKKK